MGGSRPLCELDVLRGASGKTNCELREHVRVGDHTCAGAVQACHRDALGAPGTAGRHAAVTACWPPAPTAVTASSGADRCSSSCCCSSAPGPQIQPDQHDAGDAQHPFLPAVQWQGACGHAIPIASAPDRALAEPRRTGQIPPARRRQPGLSSLPRSGRSQRRGGPGADGTGQLHVGTPLGTQVLRQRGRCT